MPLRKGNRDGLLLLGLGGQLLGADFLAMAMTARQPVAMPALIVVLGILLLLGWGIDSMRAKGYHPALGLLGLVPIAGVIVLVFLPARPPGGRGFEVVQPAQREVDA